MESGKLESGSQLLFSVDAVMLHSNFVANLFEKFWRVGKKRCQLRWASLNLGEFNKMKNAKHLLIALIVAAASLGGCATQLLPPTSTQSADFARYRFIVIEATPTVSSISGNDGNLSTREINPANLIEGLLLKKGLVRVATVASSTQAQTLLLRWGISGRRNLPRPHRGYTQEVTILLLDAQSQQSAYKCTAEGVGSTEADDIREAITSCLSGLK